MPSPSTSLATLRPDLSDSLMEFDLAMDRMGFIAHRVLPLFSVAKQLGSYGRIPLEQLLQQRDTERAPGSGYNRGKFTFTKDTFATEEHGWEEPVDDREAKMYADYFDAEQVSTQRAMDFVLRNAESRVAAAVFNATTFTSHTTAVTNEWDDLANADPIGDVETACRAVWAASGLWPNALVINRHVFRNLRRCAAVIDALEATGAGQRATASDVTAQQLAEIFDLPMVLVAGSAKNTASLGNTTPVIANIWSNEYAMVCRIPTTNDIREPGIGRTFYWNEENAGVGADGRLAPIVETYRDETIRGDVVRVRHDTDEKIALVESGHLLSNITT